MLVGVVDGVDRVPSVMEKSCPVTCSGLEGAAGVRHSLGKHQELFLPSWLMAQLTCSSAGLSHSHWKLPKPSPVRSLVTRPLVNVG